MKPLYRKIIQAAGSSFSFVEESPPLFETPWHFHPEYELILITNGVGKRYMGDSIADFDAFELILIGPNLPHFWRNADDCDLGKANAYVIHFQENFLGNEFFNLPEMILIRQLLHKAQTGLKFTGSANVEVGNVIQRLSALTPFERLIQLQLILYRLAGSTECESLSSPGFVESFQATRNERISKVYEYVMYHFRQKITLEAIASVANMSEVGFCRYFKTTTGKPFFSFLNEIRIGYACRLLMDSALNITQIAYESGFNNLAHFNRQFKTTTRYTPQQYRESFKK